MDEDDFREMLNEERQEYFDYMEEQYLEEATEQ